ncbi:MAG TPA: ABC transporter ATP-binding protein [Gaiella sp.]|nr:ABC transporter ATP-binding protein [Gaiella sp.]
MTESAMVGGPAQAGPPPPAVSMRGITKLFPGVVANDRVDFDAARGEVHALLGENGAGKSTLSNILTGLYRPDEGELWLDGRPLELGSPRDALEAGICMVHQHFRLVRPFTVAENVVLGDHRDIGRGLRFRRGEVERAVAELGERYGLRVDPRARIWQLSVGEQQRVEILKALYRDAEVLILDEPTAVLTPQEADALFRTMRAMAAEERSVIFISHKLHEVIAVADRVTVLRGGRSVQTLPIAGATPRSLAALMVGRAVEAAQRVERAEAHGTEVVLELEGVSADGDRGAGAVADVDLQLRAGEIVGIAGVAGNGQRELTETIAGMRRATAGRISVGGVALAGGDPREAIRAGIAHVPEDRLHTGLAAGLPIASNAVLTSYRSRDLARGPFLRLRAIRDRAVELIRRYDVKAPGPATPVRQLSGGNLQKIVLGREFSTGPRVLVVAAPTRGLDVGAIETVHAYLREAAADGVAVLLVSEDLDEILALADRVAVMYEGRIVGVLDAEGADVAEIGLLMAGGDRA